MGIPPPGPAEPELRIELLLLEDVVVFEDFTVEVTAI
jgi:hypothetical protein